MENVSFSQKQRYKKKTIRRAGIKTAQDSCEAHTGEETSAQKKWKTLQFNHKMNEREYEQNEKMREKEKTV